MSAAILVLLMQSTGAYTHLPKVTISGNELTTGAVNVTTVHWMSGRVDRCSVRMPRMAIPKDVQFHIDVLKPSIQIDPKPAAVPAPECPATQP